jgi:hypothetical protein
MSSRWQGHDFEKCTLIQFSQTYNQKYYRNHMYVRDFEKLLSMFSIKILSRTCLLVSFSRSFFSHDCERFQFFENNFSIKKNFAIIHVTSVFEKLWSKKIFSKNNVFENTEHWAKISKTWVRVWFRKTFKDCERIEFSKKILIQESFELKSNVRFFLW